MLYFVRHGESQANVDNIFAGPGYPAPLTRKGREQALAAGKEILTRNLNIKHFVVSPMDRAKETAEIIANTIDFDPSAIRYDERLVEHDMGSLNGKTMAGIVSSQQIVEAPGAEAPLAFQRRVVEAMKEIVQLDGDVLIVSHGGVGRILEASRLRSNLRDFYDIKGYPNATVIKLGDTYPLNK